MDPKSHHSTSAILLGAGLLLIALAGPGCKAPRLVEPAPAAWFESEFKPLMAGYAVLSEFKPLMAGYAVFEPALREFAGVKQEQARNLAARHPERPIYPDTWRFFAAARQGDWEQVHHLYWKLASMWEQPENSRPDAPPTTAVWYPVNDTYRAYEVMAHASAEFLRIGIEITNSIPPGSIYFGGSNLGRFLVNFLSASPAKGEPFFTLTQNTLYDGAYLEYVREGYDGKLNLPTSNDLNSAWAAHPEAAKGRPSPDTPLPEGQLQIIEVRNEVTGPEARHGINGRVVSTILALNPTREGFLEGQVRFDGNEAHLVPHGFIFHLHREPIGELSEDVVRRDRDFWGRHFARILGNNLALDLSVTNLARFMEQAWVGEDLSGFDGDSNYLLVGRPRGDRPADLNPAVILAAARLAIADLYLWRAQTALTESARKRMMWEADLAYRQSLALNPYDFAASQSYLDFLASQQRFDELLRLVEVTPRLFPEKELQDWQQQWRESVTREKSRL